MDAVVQAARAAMDRRLDNAASSAPVALALSGGGDSTALLMIAAAWARDAGRPLIALTVDHGLNPDSARWTTRCEAFARSLGAAWRGLAWTGEKPRTGLAAAARDARHRLLAEAARAAGARALLTGHTLDDVLEGELIRAEDAPTLGALREWSPSPAWPEGRGLFLMRPLLCVRRLALRDWLRGQGADWIEDPANADLSYARPRARAALSAADRQAPPAPAGPSIPRGVEATVDGRILAPRAAFAAPGGGRLLAAAILCAAGGSRPPRGERLMGLQARLGSRAGTAASLGGARIAAGGAAVEFVREAGEAARGGLVPMPLDPGRPVAWDGRFEVEADEPGWTVALLKGRMARLSREDRAALKALPAAARRALPVLVDGAGTVRLPRPFGHGPARAWSLAGWRLAGACGLMARESEIGDPRDGAHDLLTLCSAHMQ